MSGPDGFVLESVVHLASPWGEPVHTLEQLHERLGEVPPAVLFTHVAHRRLRHGHDDALPADDLSQWIANALQDPETAERLSFALEPPLDGTEQVRARLRAVLAAVGARQRRERRAADGAGFVFLHSASVRFPCTGIPERDLELALAEAGLATWFLYLVEDPWFESGRSELLEFLDARGAGRLREGLAEVARSGEPLGRARARLRRRLRTRGLARKVAERAASPEHERLASVHDTAVRLARRAARAEDEA